MKAFWQIAVYLIFVFECNICYISMKIHRKSAGCISPCAKWTKHRASKSGQNATLNDDTMVRWHKWHLESFTINFHIEENNVSFVKFRLEQYNWLFEAEIAAFLSVYKSVYTFFFQKKLNTCIFVKKIRK